MMCFRDKTYCNYYKSCKNGLDCHRALTPEVRVSAEAWWKNLMKGHPEHGAPIMMFTDKPKCYEEKEEGV